MPTASVNGTDLYYETLGDGPTCLVAHGWPGADHTYLRPGLDRLAEHVRLVYYDHRGNGRSAGPPLDALTMERLADDADVLAAHLGARRVLVLGHFHGASVAQELALRHPERVAGLILVAATPGELGMLESLSDAFDDTPKPPEVDVLERVPPETAEEWAATMKALAPYFFHGSASEAEALFARTTFNAEAARRAMVSLAWWSAVDRLGEVDAPVLVVAGRHDVFAGPRQSQRLARQIAQAELSVFEDSGHVPWLEEADAFFPLVETWVDKVMSGRAGES